MVTTADLTALNRAIAGTVVLPGAPDYDAVRKPAMARFDAIRPRAIVRCETAGDVVETLALARRSGVHAVPRSGGHCFAGRSSTEGLVLDVSPMRAVSLDGGAATVGAGARLAGLYDALDAHDLTIPAGCGPTVGIAGLTLGGGLGILGRRHGLTCDALLAARVVLADGRVVDCDEQHDGDLFWALRGAGGGQFGVVCSLVFRPVPAPPATLFRLVWPEAEAAAVIAAWQAWAPDAADELSASLRLTAGGDPAEPPVAELVGAMLGGEAETLGALEAFAGRVGADPGSAFHRHLPYRAAKQVLDELGADEPDAADPPGVPAGKSELFRRPLPVDAIDALVATLTRGRRAGEPREVNFTPLGGAYNRVPATATAFAHRDERYLVEHVAVTHSDEPEAGRAWAKQSWSTVHPWGSGGVYPNFPDPDLVDWAHAYHGGNYERLARIKLAYDPDGVFRFPQSLRTPRLPA